MLKAMKVETEAEGASREEIFFYGKAATELDIPLHVKIGGVEARSDLVFLEEQGVDGVIAPMVESAFAVEKFVEATQEFSFSWRSLTLESRTSVLNLTDILEVASESGISGITVGRGDLSASLGLRGQEDSSYIIGVVAEMANEIKEAGFWLTIGGNMKVGSVDGLVRSRIPFDALETRRFSCVSHDSGNVAEGASPWVDDLAEAIETEMRLLKVISEKKKKDYENDENRLSTLAQRLSGTGSR